MTITNNNNNEKDIINVFGSYIIHCNDKENINKSFKWTFDIHKCHIIGIGIISVTDSANYHKHTENDAFYSIPNPISYAITNDGSMWSNGTKHIFETLVPFSINNKSNTQNTKISKFSNNDISKSVEQKVKSNETKQSQQSNEHNKFNKKDDTQQESAETEIKTSNDNTVTSVQHKDQLNETQKSKQTDKNIVNKKGNKKRKKSLIFLSGDLFVMTVTTVFRNLEEERIWDIDQSIRDLFNPKRLYEDSLRKDIPWRQWNVWIRETIVTYLRENGRVKSDVENMITSPLDAPLFPGISANRRHATNNNWLAGVNSDQNTYYQSPNYKQIIQSNGFGKDSMITMELRLWCNTLIFYDYRTKTCQYACFDNLIVDEYTKYCIAVCLSSNDSIKSNVTLTEFSVE